MSLEYSEMEIGSDYFHKDHGKVTLVAPHPWDGCCFVIMFLVNDEYHFDTCERHDLTHLLVEEES